MTKKKKPSAAWRAVFLRALGESGNVRAAAREAGVDFKTAYNHRKKDEGFAEEWALRLRSGQPGALEETEKDSPSTGSGRTDEGLVLRNSKKHGAQWVKAGRGRWSQKAERVFLGHLAATGCFRRAAAAAWFSTTAIGNRRKAYPGFAALCDEAMAEALVTLHSLVVGTGIAALDPLRRSSRQAFAGPLEGEEIPKVSIAEAIAILRLKGPSTLRPGSGHAWLGTGSAGERLPPHMPEEPSLEEMRDEVLRRLAAMRRHREMGKEELGHWLGNWPSWVHEGQEAPARED